MTPFSVFSPAKLNLYLAVTGFRPDGFHDLVSVAVPVEFGDTLRAEPAAEFTLACDDPAVPVDATNLVLQAAAAFRLATGWTGGAAFFLEKRIPMGAGLGGGSSNAVATLRVLNEFSGGRLAPAALAECAARLGSDCGLFVPGGPVVMRGRGERVALLAGSAAARLRGRRVLIFKPGFSIATPWAYAQLAAGAPRSYLPAAQAEARLAAWFGDGQAPAETLLFNQLERPAFRKFPALPALLARLAADFGLAPRLSGSGSACFALLPWDAPVAALTGAVREAWGESATVIETRLV